MVYIVHAHVYSLISEITLTSRVAQKNRSRRKLENIKFTSDD